MDTQWVVGFVVGPRVIGLSAVLFICLYLLHVNRSLSSVPKEALALSPHRFDPKSVEAVYERLVKNPIVVDLPPKTGRRYIVVGGAGFLPGWIVLQLLARGEDPKRIRILDIRAPTRHDLTTGAAADVAFIKTDVSDAASVMDAFTAPWPDVADNVPVTVFHSAANIRYWERVKALLPLSSRINLQGTQNVTAACIAIGASILIYTSSASITTRRAGFWLWPWQRYPKNFVQVQDEDTQIATEHSQFYSNYGASKAAAESFVRKADRTPHMNGVLRTGCIRPGNGVYGPGGDTFAGAYLVRKGNPTWVKNIIQSAIYVENCALAHLVYEKRLLEMNELKRPDIGGQAFIVADPNPPVSYGDMYTVLSTLTSGETKFPNVPPVLMLILAHVLEAYYVLRLWHPLFSRLLPQIKGEVVVVQPSLFSLTQVHLVFDDSRARKSPAEGGLGFKAPWTSLEGLCKLVIEWERRKTDEMLAVGGRLSFGLGVEMNWVQK